jgi:hypothetical protein
MSGNKCNHRMGLSYFRNIGLCSDCVEREVVALRAELAEVRECLRESLVWWNANDPPNVGSIKYGMWIRWRRAAGLDTANK